MLYIKFEIKNPSKFADFQNLFQHMQETRQDGYQFEDKHGIDNPKEQADPDWENMTDKDYQEYFDAILEVKEDTSQLKRYERFIPEYANGFIESYIAYDKRVAGGFGYKKMDIFNYLEVDFEVEMDHIEAFNDSTGIVKFSTGNYPFGGIERFIYTLKAFELQPIECFDGFAVNELNWETDFVYELVNLPEKTSQYINSLKN